MVLFIVKFCHILVIISVFDIKSDQFFMFIHIVDHSLLDCRVRTFWNWIWNFFSKKITAKLAKKCDFFWHYGWSNFCLLNTMQKPHLSRSLSFRNTIFWMTPYLHDHYGEIQLPIFLCCYCCCCFCCCCCCCCCCFCYCCCLTVGFFSCNLSGIGMTLSWDIEIDKWQIVQELIFHLKHG